MLTEDKSERDVNMSVPMIRVKVLSKGNEIAWLRQFPNHEPVWGRCRFLLAPDERDFDWIFVYDELPRHSAIVKDGVLEHFCHPKNSILLTVEPANIKSYGRAYPRQFGWVLTSQPEWALPHPGRIWSQPALQWFYGMDFKLQYNDIVAFDPACKTKVISTVCSNKQQRHTLHYKRYQYIQSLRQQLGELEVFGRGVRPIQDKSEAVDAFKYHIAVENYIGPHHWTEKLADAFLGGCLPLYAGCPNVFDYFPKDSVIPIDINDPKSAAETIRRAIDENAYEKRLPAILEARKLVLEKYNLFAVISREIEARHVAEKPATPQKLCSRLRLRRRPDVAVMDVIDKTRLRINAFLNR